MADPELIALTSSDFPLIQNIARYYEYDMSRYCGHLPGWEFPLDGKYETLILEKNLKRYFQDKQRYPFLIRVAAHPAGFAMINKIGTTAEVDWNMGEFFVLATYQRRKIGQFIAKKIFQEYQGVWEVAVIPENIGALKFWHKIILEYTEGAFTQELKTLNHPEPHQMRVFRFETPSKQHINKAKLIVDFNPSKDEDAFIQEQLFSYETKKLIKETPTHFSVFLKTKEGKILGGALVWMHTESIYVQAIWIEPTLRGQGLGAKLLQKAENEALKKGCRYATLDSNYQAVGFYQRLGYKILGEIPNYIFSHSKIYLRKELNQHEKSQ